MVIDVTTAFQDGFLERLKKLAKDDKDEFKHENYKACKDHAEEMSWHVYGTKPERLLRRVRPREDPSITTYRIDSYEPITQSVCKKALSIVHKIFDPNLYSVRFEEGTDAELLEEYTSEYYPRFNNVVNYLANFILKRMMADPNGIILVQPYNYQIGAVDRVQPIATSYHSRDIWLSSDDYFLLFDKTDIDDKTQRWWFTYADATAIYKFHLDLASNGRDYFVVTESSYVHNFGELPVWYLQGDYSDIKEGIFQSFFYAAVPFWNEAVNDHSDVTGAYRMHMWPQKWEVADECEYVEIGESGRFPCNGGYVFDGQTKHKCPSCSGSGLKTAKSPYESHLVARDKFLSADGAANIQVPFGYVTVPVEATKMLEDKANNNLLKGLEALNMDVVSEIGLNQSGKAKEMDRTELNDFLKRISDVCYEIHLTNIYYFFAKYMFNVTNPEEIDNIEPEISKPTQFDIYSSTELTEQFTQAKTAKLNPSYLTVKQMEIQNKEFQTNPSLLERLNLELKLDPIAEVSPDEVSLMLANGTITKETAVIHDNIRVFIARAVEENKDFADMEPSKQREILDKYAKEVVKENKVTIDTSMIEGMQDPNQPEPKPNNLK